VLLFKARIRRSKDVRDLSRIWPLLTDDRQQWLRDTLSRLDAEHPWLERLDGELR
jgi:hypothetical protein